MYDLTVIILTHNRPSLVIETIKSVLNQEYKDFNFIVSDNSDNNETYLTIIQNNLLDRLHYIKRNNLSSLDHFNINLDEVNTKYFVLFHDDDIMLPQMIGSLHEEILRDDSIVAVGCNSFDLIGSKLVKRKKSWFKSNILLERPDSLILQQISGHFVFLPSYIYNADIIKQQKIKFGNLAGKYSDIVWLLEIQKHGKIIWLSKPLMLYRIHKEQDSAAFSYKNQQLLVNYFSKFMSNGEKNRKLKKYRIMNLSIAMRLRLKVRRKMSPFILGQLIFLIRNFKFIYFSKCCFVLVKYVLF
ncbi:hypothetical protein FACS1894142_3070 [Spirochaetia bacterium]|nr:hypothetical protein FACS1894142_3070 [Spirochaetia bacterium]